MASQWENIKWVPGTQLMVDGFRFQSPACKSYLLTHFHSDHTTGLTRSFAAGLIFCTPVTARLLRHDMGLPAARICALPLDETAVIEGTEVTPLDANHCPGACFFLFRLRPDADGRRQVILHTGDMRWSDAMAQHPKLRGQAIDILFLDTTYAKPQHTHPPQDECIAQMAEVMRRHAEEHPKTLFVVGSYHIGKERAYLGAAKLLGWRVWAEPRKVRVLRMLDLPPELMALLTPSKAEGRICVDFLGGLHPERLQQRLGDGAGWTHVVAFRPTGWTFRRRGGLACRTEGRVSIYGIPYSEHSSWPELRSCVGLLRPRRLVPTVNAANAAAARAIVNRFADLMDLSADRSRLDFFLQAKQQQQPQPEQLQGSPLVQAAARPELCRRTEAGAEAEAAGTAAPAEGAEAAEDSLSDCSCATPPQSCGGAARAAADGCREPGARSGQAAAGAEGVPEAGPGGGQLAAAELAQQQRLLRILEARHKRRQAAASGGAAKRPATLAAFFSPRACGS